MSNVYRNTFHRAVEGLEPGASGELELSGEQESEYLRSKRLEILPREYRVVGAHTVYGAGPGKTFSAALQVGQEAALVDAGHIERAKKSKADKEG